jgi:Family of unknown function (DUF6174)
MQAVALLAAALATVTPAPSLHDGAARFELRFPGGVERVRATALAAPRRTAIGAYLTCRSGGVGVLYGTAGARVRAVSAVLADGRRVRLERSKAPTGWRYRGSVFTRLMKAQVSILEVRGYDAGGHRITRVRYEPAAPCAMARPPEPKPFDPNQVDPDIVTGQVAQRLARAERRWRRAGIDDYDVQTLLSCFCPSPPAGRWIASHVRDGRRVRGSEWSAPALFTAIRRDIENRPASLEVEYGRYGVPRRIAYDGGPNISDDEITISTRRFRRR